MTRVVGYGRHPIDTSGIAAAWAARQNGETA